MNIHLIIIINKKIFGDVHIAVQCLPVCVKMKVVQCETFKQK